MDKNTESSNSYKRLILPVLVISFMALALACTNFEIDPLTTRVDENFSGEITSPADIDPVGNNNFTFSVVSDTHIGSPGGEVFKSMLNRMQSAGDSFVITCGDNTDFGKEGQYLQFKALLDAVSLPFRAAIGNHDVFFGGWTHFKNHFGRSIYSFNADNTHISIIDTANGVIGERQMKWLEADLLSSNAEHKVVVAHFPPWNGTFSSVYKMASEEEAAILKDVLHRAKVKVMFAGHYHGYNETVLGGVKYIVTGGANDLIDPGNSQHFFRVSVNDTDIRTEYISHP